MPSRSIAARCILLAAGCAVGFVAGAVLALWVFANPDPADAASFDLQIEQVAPNPALSPDDVVQIQVDALRAFRHTDAALLQCFLMASPANRAVTGPLDRFAAMVRRPKYRALILAETALVGRPTIRDDQAAVLVTVLDRQQSVRVFRFYLSRQQDRPYEGCWMTDVVKPDAKDEPPGPSMPEPHFDLSSV